MDHPKSRVLEPTALAAIRQREKAKITKDPREEGWNNKFHKVGNEKAVINNDESPQKRAVTPGKSRSIDVTGNPERSKSATRSRKDEVNIDTDEDDLRSSKTSVKDTYTQEYTIDTAAIPNIQKLVGKKKSFENVHSKLLETTTLMAIRQREKAKIEHDPRDIGWNEKSSSSRASAHSRSTTPHRLEHEEDSNDSPHRVKRSTPLSRPTTPRAVTPSRPTTPIRPTTPVRPTTPTSRPTSAARQSLSGRPTTPSRQSTAVRRNSIESTSSAPPPLRTRSRSFSNRDSLNNDNISVASAKTISNHSVSRPTTPHKKSTTSHSNTNNTDIQNSPNTNNRSKSVPRDRKNEDNLTISSSSSAVLTKTDLKKKVPYENISSKVQETNTLMSIRHKESMKILQELKEKDRKMKEILTRRDISSSTSIHSSTMKSRSILNMNSEYYIPDITTTANAGTSHSHEYTQDKSNSFSTDDNQKYTLELSHITKDINKSSGNDQSFLVDDDSLNPSNNTNTGDNNNHNNSTYSKNSTITSSNNHDNDNNGGISVNLEESEFLLDADTDKSQPSNAVTDVPSPASTSVAIPEDSLPVSVSVPTTAKSSTGKPVVNTGLSNKAKHTSSHGSAATVPIPSNTTSSSRHRPIATTHSKATGATSSSTPSPTANSRSSQPGAHASRNSKHVTGSGSGGKVVASSTDVAVAVAASKGSSTNHLSKGPSLTEKTDQTLKATSPVNIMNVGKSESTISPATVSPAASSRPPSSRRISTSLDYTFVAEMSPYEKYSDESIKSFDIEEHPEDLMQTLSPNSSRGTTQQAMDSTTSSTASTLYTNPATDSFDGFPSSHQQPAVEPVVNAQILDSMIPSDQKFATYGEDEYLSKRISHSFDTDASYTGNSEGNIEDEGSVLSTQSALTEEAERVLRDIGKRLTLIKQGGGGITTNNTPTSSITSSTEATVDSNKETSTVTANVAAATVEDVERERLLDEEALAKVEAEAHTRALVAQARVLALAQAEAAAAAEMEARRLELEHMASIQRKEEEVEGAEGIVQEQNESPATDDAVTDDLIADSANTKTVTYLEEISESFVVTDNKDNTAVVDDDNLHVVALSKDLVHEHPSGVAYAVEEVNTEANDVENGDDANENVSMILADQNQESSKSHPDLFISEETPSKQKESRDVVDNESLSSEMANAEANHEHEPGSVSTDQGGVIDEEGLKDAVHRSVPIEEVVTSEAVVGEPDEGIETSVVTGQGVENDVSSVSEAERAEDPKQGEGFQETSVLTLVSDSLVEEDKSVTTSEATKEESATTEGVEGNSFVSTNGTMSSVVEEDDDDDDGEEEGGIGAEEKSPTGDSSKKKKRRKKAKKKKRSVIA